MTSKRFAFLSMAAVALVAHVESRAQDRLVIPDDPLAVVDSVVVNSDGPVTAAWFRIPRSALVRTLMVFRDRSMREPVLFEIAAGDSTATVSSVSDATWLYVRYRPNPALRDRRFVATSIVGPPDPDSVSSYVPVQAAGTRERASPPSQSRITRSGSITRGVIAGNRRDATIESGLRMQLAGEIVDGVQLRAVLSDENTPIVPEGTTQRISEFDKVSIEIESARLKAQLGDFEIAIGADSYARLSRKLQGAQVSALWPGVGSALAGGRASVAGAVARGIFRSQSLQILEGVQGPYRLEGADGERFIILIPGSEVVYLDGLRLERGITDDYVVDYATAEVTFTSRRVMSPDRRVLVEFQYTTNQFTRTVVATEVMSDLWRRADGSSRATIGVTLLRESDGNQFADEFGLSAADSLLLASSGDGRAARSGATVVDFDPEAPFVQYRLEIQPGPAGLDTVFVALDSVPVDSQLVYRVQFSLVETGTGSYARAGRSINGILYEYVGKGGGDYEPIRLLPRPRRQQLFDIRASVEPLPNLRFEGEWAHSQLDLNRLSKLDAADDGGDAFNVSAVFDSPSFQLPLIRESSVKLKVTRSLREGSFNTFDRIRSVEFTRDWNLPFEVSSTGGAVAGQSESVTLGQVSVSSNAGELGFEGGRLSLGPAFTADRLVARLRSGDSVRTTVRYLGERIDSQSGVPDVTGSWVRHSGRLGFGLGRVGLGPYVEVEHEDRVESAPGLDSLNFRSVRFTEIRPGIAWRQSNVVATLETELRTEDRPLDGVLADAATSRTILSSVQYRPQAPIRVEANVGVRRTESRSAGFSAFGIEDRQSVVLGTNGDFRPLNRAVSVSWLYEAQTERTPKLQEVYIRIGPELGEYVWSDENEDGAIQIEEFLLETTPNEGTYARTFVPSDSLFSIVGVKARARLDIRPERILRDAETQSAAILRSVTSSTTVEVSEKNRGDDTFAIYALRQSRFRTRGSTLNGRLLLRQDFSFGRPASRFGTDVSLSRVQSLSDLAAGLEERRLGLAGVTMRFRASDQLRLQGGVRLEQNRVESANFSSRTFDLRSRVVSAEANVIASAQTTLTGGFDVAWRKDDFGSRRATILKLPFEVRYQRARRYQISTRFEFANVALTGAATGLAQFELTDGRGAGRSALWSVVGQWSFNQYLRGSVAYDGRAPSTAPVIHTMRMQLSAVF